MLIEFACLAIDAAVTSTCYYCYRKCVNLHKTVQESSAAEKSLEENLNTLLHDSRGSLPYVCISGQIDVPGDGEAGLPSQYRDGVYGVIQKLVTKEHRTQRIQGFWTDIHRVVRDSVNVIPFCIKHGPLQVKVSEPLESRFIDEHLTVTHDVYKPKTGIMLVDRLFGDVSKGIRDTEKMLKIGTTVLGFGRLVLDSGALSLEKPDRPSHYIITSLSKPELLKTLQQDVSLFKVLTAIFGLTGLGISYICVRKLIKDIFHEGRNEAIDDEEARFLEPLREARRRRSETGHEEENDNHCVVCINRQREVVLLNCGHICVCADCAEEMFHPGRNGPNHCPICRARVERLMPIFMA